MINSDSENQSITLRFEPGQSFDKGINSERMCTLESQDSWLLLQQMAGALSHLHARSLVHDDVKPENIIWIPSEKRAVLIDFGAALDFTKLPQGGYFNPSGTPSYVPPEFLNRKKGPKADVWALGVVALFALGHLPLPGGNWLLPATLNEGKDRSQMLQWLDEIDTLRSGQDVGRSSLARMLDSDPDARISSSDLVQQLRA
jgi:serine/threonine protein kinase